MLNLRRATNYLNTKTSWMFTNCQFAIQGRRVEVKLIYLPESHYFKLAFTREESLRTPSLRT